MIDAEGIANILNDDSFKQAMKDIVKTHMDMLINSDVDDKVAREICYICLLYTSPSPRDS